MRLITRHGVTSKYLLFQSLTTKRCLVQMHFALRIIEVQTREQPIIQRVPRTGWVRKKVCGGKTPESVADHMYRMAVLAFLLEPEIGLDKHRCMKIALVHDMAESIVGDLTPQDGITKEEKHRKEKKAMHHICSLVDESVGSEMYTLWEEYEEQSSKEAEFIKDIDKFEMILQAYEYEQIDGKPGYLQEFFDTTQGKFKTDQVNLWVKALEAKRNATQDTQKKAESFTF